MLYPDGNRLFSLNRFNIISLGSPEFRVIITISSILICVLFLYILILISNTTCSSGSGGQEYDPEHGNRFLGDNALPAMALGWYIPHSFTNGKSARALPKCPCVFPSKSSVNSWLPSPRLSADILMTQAPSNPALSHIYP